MKGTGTGRLIRCSVPSCRNYKYFKEETTNRPDLVFFSFPRDRKNQWALAIGRPEYVKIKKSGYNSHHRVCSDHFQESDFKPVVADKLYLKDKKRLRRDAVPSLLLSSTQGERRWEELAPELSPAPPLSTLPPLQKMENVETLKKENCLICSEMTCAKTGAESPLLSGVHHHKFNGSTGIHLLNEQLWSTFILLRILELPVCKFEDILKAAGENNLPGEWFLVCDVCSRSLVQLVEMEEKVRALQLQVEKLKNKLQVDFRRSLETEERVKTETDEFPVRETIRNFFVIKNAAQTVEVKEESRDEYEEDNNDFHSDDNSESGTVASKDFLVDLQEETKLKRKRAERPSKDGKERNFPCSECNLRFYTRKGRYSHISRKHPEMVGRGRVGRPKGPEKVKPRKAPKQDGRTKVLKKVKPRKGPKKAGRRKGPKKDSIPLEICEICGFKETKKLMKRHVFHHKIFDNSVDPAVSTTEFICNICKQLFPTRTQITFHKVNTHAEELGLQVYKCSYCSRNFMRKNDRICHEMRVHQKRGLYPCDKCDYEAMSKPTLEIHMAKHSETPVICEYCSATYFSTHNLRAHIQRYHPDKFIPADKKRFVGLDVEKLSTEGDKPTYNFVMRKKQKEQKPINCKYCEAVLPHKLGFNLHLKESHKDMYKYQCDMCDKVYLSTASLTLHKKINHQEKGKPVKCAWCLKSVAHRLYLYSHGKVCPKRPKGGENIPKIMAIEENCEDADVEENNVCVEGEHETIG